MYRWDDIEVFVTLVRSETMTEAARVLNLTQATVSRRVAILEEALGGALFARTPEGVTPTELGLALLPRAEEMEAAQRALMSEASAYGSAPSGVVTLASTDDLTEHLLVPMLGVFRARHPGVFLNLVTGVGLRDMSRLEADLALRFVRPTRGEQLRVARLGAFTFGVYAARSYLDARGAWSAPEELDWIDWSEHLSMLPEARWRRAHLPEVVPVVTASSMGVRRAAGVDGLGAVVLPRSVARRHADVLVELEHPWPELPTVGVWLVAHEATRHTPRVRAVWDFIVEESKAAFERQRVSPGPDDA